MRKQEVFECKANPLSPKKWSLLGVAFFFEEKVDLKRRVAFFYYL